jgi:AcrR family transcriptional regulator
MTGRGSKAKRQGQASQGRAKTGRRREILQAALASFEALGYEAATIEDIRRRSRASIGSIYHHFGGKAGIASALYAEGLSDYQAGLLARMRRARGARALIKGVVRHHIDWAAANPAWARYLMETRRLEAVAAIEVQLRELNQAFVRDVLPLIRPHMDRGEITPLPLEILLPLVFGPPQEFLRRWLEERTELGLRKARELLAEAAWKSVQPG